MIVYLKAACFALFALAVAGCTQITGSSSYSGNIGKAGLTAGKPATKKKSVVTKVASRRARKKSRRRARSRRASRNLVKAAYRYRRSGRIKSRGSFKCIPGRLKAVLAQVARRYGPVTISSSHRSRRKNRRVGGKRKSYHLRCQAVDFRVRGRTRGLTRYLARHPGVGGYKRYRAGFYHIDTGPKRTW